MGKGKSDLALPLTELEDYGRRLRSLKTRLNHTKKLFESYKDDIGDGSVNDALGDFESNWEDGREDITQQLDALADMSDAVVREFKKLDDELTKKVNGVVKTEDKRGGGKGGGDGEK
ncbi:hypothetical protein SAM23877_4366 [Streptomyces ambofaciens ATCC 23877]|uniref:Uncharacterized protein n=1 Tax=Streptomyces ambofaciens (strain ATCC 23877 / 3486 / DSM 40053 / JCM 4204 / NBRC 12836 / NRRL B-2516) TaxID=278992 RepID=A0A0K2AWY1_STRA7|nr:hypothetical protein [Streptomyces ambofaciens]AKZ57411.1 hypothetical protein SAM23877_4366 [Streptomyces ambofaciens ATCC 23877]